MSPRRQLAIALTAVVVVATPGLLGRGVDFPDDALYYSVASWEWLRYALSEGLSIWFVPGKLGGVSLYGDVVPMGPLYPGAWLALVMPVVPALGVAAMLHAVGTLLAVRWLARTCGASANAATLAGAGVVLGPLGTAAFIDFHVDSWPAFLWLPVVLGCLERLGDEYDRTRRLRWIGLGGMALAALLLGSHLRVSAAACGTIGLWVLVRWRDIRGALAVSAFGLLAGAPGFVPMLLESRIAAEGAIGVAGLGVPIDQAIGWPALSGWLSPTVLVVDRDVSLGTICGVGALGCLSMRSAAVRAESTRIAICVVILVAAGSHLPGVRYLFAPLLLLSHPVNLVWPVMATIPAAVLAARGLDTIVKMDHRERSLWVRGPAGALVIALVTLGLMRLALGSLAFRSGPGWTLHAVSMAQAVGVLAVGAVLLFPSGRRAQPTTILFLVAIADLLLFGLRAQLAVPSTPLVAAADAYEGDVAALGDGYLDIADLAAGFDSAVDSDHDDEIGVPERDAPAMQADLLRRTWPPHLGMAVGVRALAGRSKLMPARQLEALRPLAEAIHGTGGLEFFLPELFGKPEGLGTTTLALHGMDVAVWKDVVGYRVEQVAPLCYAALTQEVVTDTKARVARLLDSHERYELRPALLESPLSTLLPDRRPPPEHLSCSEPGMTDVSASHATLVVRRQRWHPGWKVTDTAGEPLETFPVNQVHLGVVVPAGTTRIMYRFVPPGLRPALCASFLGWSMLGMMLLASRRRR